MLTRFRSCHDPTETTFMRCRGFGDRWQVRTLLLLPRLILFHLEKPECLVYLIS